MSIGFDCGTYTLISCKRDEEKNFVHKKEINAFIEIPIENRFVFNMMRNAKVPLIERAEAQVAYALGQKAVDIAYTMNQVALRRPMEAGCLNPKEKSAQQIMNIMIQSMLDNVATDKETLYYSVPANAINEETDADYHSKILEAIFKAFKDESGKTVSGHPINEGLALVYAELSEKQWTGLGISWGAGMVNVCFSIFGAPAFQFSLVNSGDWIDKKAAKATGETPTFINQEKVKVDLSQESDSMVHRAIKAQYEIMIQRTIQGIKRGVEEGGSSVRTDGAIDIVIAGGTSTPKGFPEMFGELLKKSNMPIEIGQVIRPKDPLYSVSRGCLIAAEAADQN